jgi:hypothetical protein
LLVTPPELLLAALLALLLAALVLAALVLPPVPALLLVAVPPVPALLLVVAVPPVPALLLVVAVPPVPALLDGPVGLPPEPPDDVVAAEVPFPDDPQAPSNPRSEATPRPTRPCEARRIIGALYGNSPDLRRYEMNVARSPARHEDPPRIAASLPRRPRSVTISP